MEIWLNTLADNLNNPKSERYPWIYKNINLYPKIKIIPSVDGRNKEKVEETLKNTGLDFYQTGFKTYGTLAVFLSKFLAWEKQIQEYVPYMCLIEDDLELTPEFLPFLEEKKHLLDDPKVNILRLGDWGEAYFTSLESAKRLVKKIRKDGIRRNVDEQMWGSGEVVVNESLFKPPREDEWVNGVWRHKGYKNNIFKLLKKTNSGTPLQTSHVGKNLSKSYYAGGAFDIKEDELDAIINKSSGKRYLTFCLGSAAILLLKKLKAEESLTVYEWGESYTSFLEYKNDFKIPDSKLVVKNLSGFDPDVLKEFGKRWGTISEETPNKTVADLVKIDYQYYDVYILDGFTRGLIAFLALYSNSKAEVFIHDANRNWYDWLKSIFRTETIGENTLKFTSKQ